MRPQLTLSTLSALLLSGWAMTAQAQSPQEPDRSVASVQASVDEAPAAHADAGPHLDTVATTPAPHHESAPLQSQSEPAQAARSARRIVIGSATEQLFAMQRDLPAQRPRHIDGEQASLSYQRYLKSFETSIPEKYDTGMDVKQ